MFFLILKGLQFFKTGLSSWLAFISQEKIYLAFRNNLLVKNIIFACIKLRVMFYLSLLLSIFQRVNSFNICLSLHWEIFPCYNWLFFFFFQVVHLISTLKQMSLNYTFMETWWSVTGWRHSFRNHKIWSATKMKM